MEYVGATYFDLQSSGVNFYKESNSSRSYLDDEKNKNEIQQADSCIIEYLYNDLVSIPYRIIREIQDDPLFESLTWQWYEHYSKNKLEEWKNSTEYIMYDEWVKSIFNEYIGNVSGVNTSLDNLKNASTYIGRYEYELKKVRDINPNIDILILSDPQPIKSTNNLGGLPYEKETSTWGVVDNNNMKKVKNYNTNFGDKKQTLINQAIIDEYSHLYTDKMEQLAKEYNIAYIDLWNETKDTITDGTFHINKAQAMHLNQKGHDYVASYVKWRLGIK